MNVAIGLTCLIALLSLPTRVLAQPAPPPRLSVAGKGGPTSDPDLNTYITRRDLEAAPFATQHFLIRGPRYREKVRIGNWAEAIYRQVETELGTKLPFRRGRFIRVTLDEKPGHANVSPAQSVLQGNLVQRLNITNLHRLDQEEMLEALSFLLCSRLVWQANVRAGRPQRVPELAEWFSTGLAQHMTPGLLTRDRALVCDMWKDGRSPVIYDLLQQVVFKQGRTNEKAASALLYGFLKEQPDARQLFRKLFIQWANGDDVDYNWLLDNMEAVATEEQLEQDWDLYMALNDSQRKVWNRPLLEQVEGLKALLRFTPRSLGVTGHPKPGQLMTWDDLPNFAEDDPSRDLILGQLQTRLGLLGLGQPPNFKELLGEFSAYLAGVSSEPPNKLGRPRSEVVSENLKKRLAWAERQLALFQIRLEDARSLIELARPATPEQLAALEPMAPPDGPIYVLPPGSRRPSTSPPRQARAPASPPRVPFPPAPSTSRPPDLPPPPNFTQTPRGTVPGFSPRTGQVPDVIVAERPREVAPRSGAEPDQADLLGPITPTYPTQTTAPTPDDKYLLPENPTREEMRALLDKLEREKR